MNKLFPALTLDIHVDKRTHSLSLSRSELTYNDLFLYFYAVETVY